MSIQRCQARDAVVYTPDGHEVCEAATERDAEIMAKTLNDHAAAIEAREKAFTDALQAVNDANEQDRLRWGKRLDAHVKRIAELEAALWELWESTTRVDSDRQARAMNAARRHFQANEALNATAGRGNDVR